MLGVSDLVAFSLIFALFAESDKDDVSFDFADLDLTGTRPIRHLVLP